MTYPNDLSQQHLVTIPRASLAALRTSLLRDAGSGYATYLQDAGAAGGDTIYNAFRDWLAARGADAPDALPLTAFMVQAGAFFADTGWGRVDVARLGDVAATLDSSDWAEADPDAHLDHPGCHFTTGLLADFLGRVAGGPLAVFEVECRSSGAQKCRFVTGSADVMRYVYERVAGGAKYMTAIGELE